MEQPRKLRILVVDDERNIRTTLSACLEALECQVTAVASAAAAVVASTQTTFSMALVDLRIGEESGIDLIPKLLANLPSLHIVLITAYATVDSAVEAIKKGAADYLAKPFTPSQIAHLVARVVERRQLTARLFDLETQVKDSTPELDLATNAPKMKAALEMLFKAAESNASVLLRGESGTGKNLFARALHKRSPRAHAPFVIVNVATLSNELIMSELFGHTRGAFTGAVKDQQGKVEAADGGTLFLDEIAELTPETQAKLLRFLQDHEFERVGETRTRHADVRIVAATNRPIEKMIEAGTFREDLFYRISVVDVTVPSLRDRREDIRQLAQSFLVFFAASMRRPVTPELDEAALYALERYDWPGNVRELRNTIERLLVLNSAQTLTAEALPDRLRTDPAAHPELGGDFTLEEIEREHILRVMNRVGTQEAAARILGIDTSTLWRKRKRL